MLDLVEKEDFNLLKNEVNQLNENIIVNQEDIKTLFDELEKLKFDILENEKIGRYNAKIRGANILPSVNFGFNQSESRQNLSAFGFADSFFGNQGSDSLSENNFIYYEDTSKCIKRRIIRELHTRVGSIIKRKNLE